MAIYISSGVTSGMILTSNTAYVTDTGSAVETIMNNDGRMHLSSGGKAYDTTINSGGTLFVSSVRTG